MALTQEQINKFRTDFGLENVGQPATPISSPIGSPEERIQRLRAIASRTQEVTPTPTEPTDEEFDFSAIETLKNIPGSAGRLLKDVFNVALHPIQTAKSLGELAAGVVNLSRPGVQPQEEKARAVGQFFKERFGGLENIKRNIQEDPVGFMADASLFLTGGGAALRGVGTVSKAGRVAKVGQAIQKAGLATEPITTLGKGAFIATRPITRPVGALLRESLGVTTGAGGQVIREAFRNPTPEFRQALRGQVTTDNVLTAAREGLYKLKDQRSTAYRTNLAKLKEAKKPINNTALNEFVDEKLKQFNISTDKQGNLDFSKSVIADTTEQKRMSEIVTAVKTWDDTTALGLDTLKQRLDDFYTPSGKGRALTNAIRDKVKSTIIDNVKGYNKMVSEYAEATELIKSIENTLSLKAGANVDTTIRKLMSSMRQNNEFRKGLVEKLDTLTKRDITSQLAGTALAPGVPSGLVGRQLFAGASVAGVTGVGLGAISPALLTGLLLASPRVVGEMLRALGISTKAVKSILEFIKSPAGKLILQGGFQAGRIEEVE